MAPPWDLYSIYTQCNCHPEPHWDVYLPCGNYVSIGVTVLPAILYGVELWAAHDLLGVACRRASLYHAACFTLVLDTLKHLAGLPSTTFSAPVDRLFQLPTVFEPVLPRLVCLLSTLSVPILEGL